MSIRPAADAELEIRADALDRVRVQGAASGTARLDAQLRSLTFTGLDGTRGRRGQATELVLSIGRADCRRLARALRGGCAEAARGSLRDPEVTVASKQPLLVTLTGAAADDLVLENAGALSSARLDAGRMRARIGCLTPWQRIVLTIDGRPRSVPYACTPGDDATTSLHVMLRRGAKPVVDLADPSYLAAAVPGREATVIGDRPVLVVNGDSTAWRENALSTTIRPDEPDTITVAMDRPGRYGTFRIAVPRARDLHVANHGEQLPALLDKGRDIWIGVAGILVGIGITQVVGLASGVRT